MSCVTAPERAGNLSQHYGAGFSVTALADLVVNAMRLPEAQNNSQLKPAGEMSPIENF